MLWRPLLLDGIATSTKLSGESESQRAMVGMFMYELSTRAWWSVRGSQTITRRGSKNLLLNIKIGNNLLLGVLVSKSTWGPLSSEVVGLSVSGELEDGSLCVFSVGNDLSSIAAEAAFR